MENERETLITEIFLTFQRIPNKKFILQIVSETNKYDITELLDACKNIKNKPEMPKNITYEIKKIIGVIRLRKHQETKDAEYFESESITDTGRRYLRLLSKTFQNKSKEFHFTSFWETANEIWYACENKTDQEKIQHIEQMERMYENAIAENPTPNPFPPESDKLPF